MEKNGIWKYGKNISINKDLREESNILWWWVHQALNSRQGLRWMIGLTPKFGIQFESKYKTRIPTSISIKDSNYEP